MVTLCLSVSTIYNTQLRLQEEVVGRSGMDEAEYEAAAAQTAQLAAQLPRIGIATRPAPGPSMPQRIINRFRNQEAVLGKLPSAAEHAAGISSVLL